MTASRWQRKGNGFGWLAMNDWYEALNIAG